jgi:putative hydrolase of the HAD superfamily
MKALIFDLDDTLMVEEASAEAAFRATCGFAAQKSGVDPERLYTNIRESCRSFWHDSPARSYCLEVGISSWEGLWAEFSGDDENLRILAEWAPVYRRNSWVEALRRCGCDGDDTFAKELGEKYIQERRQRHIVYDDVLPVLNHLRQNHKLALLTNGSPDLQRAKLKAPGLADFFHTIVVSGEVGLGKPDPRIFEMTLNHLDATPNLAAMIGNSLKSDIAPALKLGLLAIWVNREGKVRNNVIVPDAEVSDLKQLINVLE